MFDGIATGRLALERAGIHVDTYYASEIDKYSIKIAIKNYPDIIQLGDVTQLSDEKLLSLGQIDLLIGGSPCQDLSVYKLNINDAKGLEGKKSSLFYHYVRVLRCVKPKHFLLENVLMAEEWEDVITSILEVEPIMINSNLLSAQERKRLYWTDIPDVVQPEDKGILIKDIIVPSEEVADKYWYDIPFIYNGDDKKVQCTLDIKKGFQRNMKEVYNQNAKCNTLLADGDGGNRQKKVYQDGRCRKFTPLEYERLQTLPDNYTDGVADCHRYSAIGSGWTCDVIAHIFSFMKVKIHMKEDKIVVSYKTELKI